MSRELTPDARRARTEFTLVTQESTAMRAAVRAGSRLEQRTAAQPARETSRTNCGVRRAVLVPAYTLRRRFRGRRFGVVAARKYKSEGTKPIVDFYLWGE